MNGMSLSSAPEPGTLSLYALGLLGFLAISGAGIRNAESPVQKDWEKGSALPFPGSEYEETCG